MRAAAAGLLVLALAAAAPCARAAPGPTSAAPPADSRNERAIARGEAGVEAFDRGDWSAALAAFREADQLFHSPVFTLYEARCLRNLGRLREAKARFESTARETFDDAAPKTWAEAKKSASAELTSLDAELPRVRIELVGASGAAVASLDGATVAIGQPLEVDPGGHDIEAHDGALVRRMHLIARRGDATRVAQLDMTPPQAAAAPGPSGWLIAGASLASVGAVALVVGGALGGVALGRASDAAANLPRSCDAQRRCLEGDQQAVDAAYADTYSFASAADGLLLGGGALVASGLVFVLVDRLGARSRKVQPTAHGLVLAF